MVLWWASWFPRYPSGNPSETPTLNDWPWGSPRYCSLLAISAIVVRQHHVGLLGAPGFTVVDACFRAVVLFLLQLVSHWQRSVFLLTHFVVLSELLPSFWVLFCKYINV